MRPFDSWKPAWRAILAQMMPEELSAMFAGLVEGNPVLLRGFPWERDGFGDLLLCPICLGVREAWGYVGTDAIMGRYDKILGGAKALLVAQGDVALYRDALDFWDDGTMTEVGLRALVGRELRRRDGKAARVAEEVA